MYALGLAAASSACAGEIKASNLTVERVLINSNRTANQALVGQIWVKVNRDITEINAGCPSNWHSQNGYLVAAFKDDPYAKQMLAGLLTAKAAGLTITAWVDDTSRNASDMCTVTFYEIE
ncbi:MAG TPA: hypothetical protein VGD45_01430 [Steroidobacter sp.]|uniref:hypothetical protein n=1 Tax=Steroidobacter sp. TaxID=1978227 RepID=UPI002EDA6B9D